MGNQRLLKRIRQLGFTEYEAKCYLALFERDSLAVSDVSILAKIPRSNAYEALERLSAKGVIVAVPGKIKKYAASDPWVLKEKALETFASATETEIEVLERRRLEILEKKKRDIRDRKKAVQEDIEDIVKELDSLYKVSRSDASPLYSMEILRDPIQVHRKATLLSAISQKELLFFIRPPYYYSALGAEDIQIDAQIGALKRGVNMRKIQQLRNNEKERKQFYDYLKSTDKYEGGEQRVLDELPIKLAVADERYCMYALDDPTTGKEAAINVITDNRTVAKAFKLLFESYWAMAKDYLIINGKKCYLNKWDPTDPTVKYLRGSD
jgi:HTH-type transcriptional regulator, sugar sensing transcriptional regulator